MNPFSGILPKQSIYTNNPEQEIWNYISDFESEYFVNNFVRKRISDPGNIHKLFFSYLNKNKRSNISQQITKDIENLSPIQSCDLNGNLVSEIANNARQAHDLYIVAKELPMLSRPILLLYAFEKLANMLVLLTFKTQEGKGNYFHGLTYFKQKPIEVKSKGLFQRFHDCYCFDPSIYIEKRAFKTENLVNAGHTSHMEIVNLMKNDSLATNRIINENASVEVSIHELDREFIFLFGISTLARYRVNEWNDILSGRNNDLILKIQRYLQSVQLSFPNLILNILYDKIFLFYQPTQLS